jgi:uncharacterized membrane protein
MDRLKLQFPEDVREERVRAGQNISEAERYVSMAAGTGLALYGITRGGARGWTLAGLGAWLVKRGYTGHCEAYRLLGVSTAGTGQDTRQALGGSAGVIVEESVIINRPVSELYRFWRNLENLPRFMSHLESVERITDTLSRWRAKAPAGGTVEWNAEIINEVPDQVIGWRSIEGSDVVSAGSVNFEELPGRGTKVRVRLQYSPPGGKIGDAVARLFGADAATQIRQDLQRFKAMVETGQATT